MRLALSANALEQHRVAGILALDSPVEDEACQEHEDGGPGDDGTELTEEHPPSPFALPLPPRQQG